LKWWLFPLVALLLTAVPLLAQEPIPAPQVEVKELTEVEKSQKEANTPEIKADSAWMLVATALVMLMVPGLALFYGGMVRRKNILATMMQSMVCLAVVGVYWVAIGYSLAFGAPWIKTGWGSILGFKKELIFLAGIEPNTILPGTNIPIYLHMLFQGMFAIITPALISGAVAERIRFKPYCIFLILWSTFVYCPLAHCVWAMDWWDTAVEIAKRGNTAVGLLGNTTTGVMSNDRELVDLFYEAGGPYGERYWELPLFPEYADLIKSPIADMKNSGGRAAGTIYGAMFLKEFVGDAPWIHLDIAGTSWTDRDAAHIVKGPTAVALRPLVRLAELLAKRNVHRKADEAAYQRLTPAPAISTNGALKTARSRSKATR